MGWSILSTHLTFRDIQFNKFQSEVISIIVHYSNDVCYNGRANSALKHIKRSTMGQERLNALLLLYTYKDITLNYETVDLYSVVRRMIFMKPLLHFVIIL